MSSNAEHIQQWVEWLQNGSNEEQFQAATALRTLAGQAGNKPLIREAGGIEALLGVLDDTSEGGLAVLGAETLSCLAADDAANRVSAIRY